MSDISTLKAAHDVSTDHIAAALREAAEGCRDGNCRRAEFEDEVWDVTEATSVHGALRALADDVQSRAATVTALNYSEYIAAETPVEERLEVFFRDQTRGEYHLSVTYVPTASSGVPDTTDTDERSAY